MSLYIRTRLVPFVGSLFIMGATLGFSFASDEQILFFPKFASLTADGRSWQVQIHAWVFEPEEASRSSNLLLKLLVKKLGLSPEQSEAKLFQQRARSFLVDNERGKRLTLRVGDQNFEVGPSESNGHIVSSVIVSREVAERFSTADVDRKGRVLQLGMVSPDGSGTVQTITVPLVEPHGISVISDIDDTIKVSEVASRSALLANTFLRDYTAVPRMSELYRNWRSSGAEFHYVSASPWQLAPPLLEFLEMASFPKGSLSLKSFRWKDSSFFDLFTKGDEVKRPLIESILKAFPTRKFVLVGDTGERDAELYADMAQRYAPQIKRVYLRNLDVSDDGLRRLEALFKNVPASIWRLFRDPQELTSEAFEIFSNPSSSP